MKTSLSAGATKTALFSSSAKPPELKEFAIHLYNCGWNILASEGTAKFLNGGDHGWAQNVAIMVGEPILGHKVVTLSREVHAGILADLDNPKDVAELARINVSPINLVYVDLYPLEEEMKKSGATIESVLAKTDIGGPTMLRAAAKGRRVVLVDPRQFPDTLDFLNRELAEEMDDLHRQSFLSTLAADAEKKCMLYSGWAYRFHKQVSNTGQYP